VADALAFLAADERTRAVGLFLEAVRRPAAFEEGLRRMADAGKPVIVLKVGTSAVAARAATPTAAVCRTSEAAAVTWSEKS